MITDRDTLDRWYSGEKPSGVAYSLNDVVIAPPGDVSGDLASVISLESVNPSVTFLIERTSGASEVVAQSDLALLIYMPMLDECTDVWRPVAARPVRDFVAKVLSTCPEDEQWCFPSGTLVEYKERNLSGGARFVAVREAGNAA